MNKPDHSGSPARANSVLNDLRGNRNLLARAITVLENNLEGRNGIYEAIRGQLGNGHVIGVTGPPGVGKSTLIDSCIPVFREHSKSVAVLAVDPSSRISGGAILGDRVRMARHTEDDGVFIRSVAARGHLGGLSPTTLNIINLFDAAKWEVIIVETVGTGQSEIEISELADTTVVVESPGHGDEIQAIKAGLLEVADIIVVNKSDHPQVDLTVSDLENSILLRHSKNKPQVMKTIATSGDGVSELVGSICEHRQNNKQRDRSELTRNYIARALGAQVELEFANSKNDRLDALYGVIESGHITIEDLARTIAEEIVGSQS